MKYNPQEVKENEFILLAEGTYNFKTISCKESISKSSGAEMLVLELEVYGNDGKTYPHTMYITSKSLFNLKSYWESVGHPEMFVKLGDGHDEHAYTDKCGVLKTKIDSYIKDGNEFKNSKVKYFVKQKDQKNQEKADTFIEDELPF